MSILKRNKEFFPLILPEEDHVTKIWIFRVPDRYFLLPAGRLYACTIPH
jgi:hypothetical protein